VLVDAGMEVDPPATGASDEFHAGQDLGRSVGLELH
jgi:hypothetical protein